LFYHTLTLDDHNVSMVVSYIQGKSMNVYVVTGSYQHSHFSSTIFVQIIHVRYFVILFSTL